jgi:hypothetical protein
MPLEDSRALTAVYCSILSAVDLATGKPASALAGQILREIAKHGPPDLTDVLMNLADAGDDIEMEAEIEASDA